jgi:hypothetical protein
MFRRTFAPAFAIAALGLVTTSAQAQSHPIVGAWDIEYAAGMHVENGEPTPVMAKGRMTVVAQGDSLIATVKTVAPEGMPARPDLRLATTAAPGQVTFVYRSQARVNLNGEESVRESVTTWLLDASGDSLTGTMVRQIGGGELPAGPPQPVKGTRTKG